MKAEVEDYLRDLEAEEALARLLEVYPQAKTKETS